MSLDGAVDTFIFCLDATSPSPSNWWPGLDLPVMADRSWDLPAKLLSIFDSSTEQSSLVHELFGNAANINTRATETPFGAYLEKHFPDT